MASVFVGKSLFSEESWHFCIAVVQQDEWLYHGKVINFWFHEIGIFPLFSQFLLYLLTLHLICLFATNGFFDWRSKFTVYQFLQGGAVGESFSLAGWFFPIYSAGHCNCSILNPVVSMQISVYFAPNRQHSKKWYANQRVSYMVKNCTRGIRLHQDGVWLTFHTSCHSTVAQAVVQ